MFESDLLEACSKVHPAMPALVYGPVVIALMIHSLWPASASVPAAAAWFVAGCAVWQWMEYAIHRYFFHWEGRGPLTRRLHAIIHGYHHQYPDDRQRLMMPLGASLPAAALLFGILSLLLKPTESNPFFCGIVSGYLVYDYLHWNVHARRPRSAWGKALRAHHMAHHFARPDTNFGISHRWIDALLGTAKRSRSLPGTGRDAAVKG